MLEVSVNYWAILVSGLIFMALGNLWYSPLFGKPWRKLNGLPETMSEEQKKGMMKKMMPAMIVSFIASIVLACVLAHVIVYTNSNTAAQGLEIAFWLWLGFIATTMLVHVMYLQKSLKLFAIDSSMYLVYLLAIGAMLAVWR